MLTKFVRSAIYYQGREIFEIREEPCDYGIKYDEVNFRSQDGCRLHGWWIPHRKPAATVVFCHGNAANIGDYASLSQDLAFLKVNLFLFDYRGYGKSEGRPTEIGIGHDVRAAFDQAFCLSPKLPIVVMGQSLGGAVAVELARSRAVAGLVVESSFSCIAEVAKTFPGLSLLPARLVQHLVKKDGWDSLSKVSQLEMPKLFAHSRKDEVVPFELGKRLYDNAAEPKLFCHLAGGHNDDKLRQERYRSALRQLVGSLSRGQSAR